MIIVHTKQIWKLVWNEKSGSCICQAFFIEVFVHSTIADRVQPWRPDCTCLIYKIFLSSFSHAYNYPVDMNKSTVCCVKCIVKGQGSHKRITFFCDHELACSFPREPHQYHYSACKFPANKITGNLNHSKMIFRRFDWWMKNELGTQLCLGKAHGVIFCSLHGRMCCMQIDLGFPWRSCELLVFTGLSDYIWKDSIFFETNRLLMILFQISR